MNDTNQSKKKLTLFDIILVLLFLPFYLLFSKKTRKVSWAIVLIVLAIIFVPKLMGGMPTGGERQKLDLSLIMYRCDEGADQEVMDRLNDYFEEEKYADAEKLMQANEWFAVIDAAQAADILDKVEASKQGERKWLAVMDRIKCEDRKIIDRLDGIYFSLGYRSFYRFMNLESAAEVWSKCSEGSAGQIAVAGFTKIMDGDLIGGAQILNEYSKKDEEVREDFELCYSYILEKAEYTTLEEHLDYMLAHALISGITPASSSESLEGLGFQYRPNDYLHNRTEFNYTTIYDKVVLDDALRAQLPSVLKKARGNKVLVVDRVLICGTDEIKIAVNPFMMESLPEQYRARSFEEVGYVLVMDYGYEKDGIWYAGTTMATLYELSGGTALYKSKELVGTYEMSYYGTPTKVIFGSYPGVKHIVAEALAFVK